MNEVSDPATPAEADIQDIPIIHVAAPLPPLPSCAPYRALPGPETIASYNPPRPRLVWGPALQTYALLLWSYLVVGQLTTTLSASVPIGQGEAVFFVIAITGAAWVTSVRRSQRVAPASPARLVLRAAFVLALAGLGVFGSVLAATVVAAAAGPVDFPVLLVFVLLASAAWLKGRRVLEPESAPLTHDERAVFVGVGIVVVLVTVIAGADLATNG